MKKETPDVVAFVFGLAALVFLAKGLLATFWQKLPGFGYVWFAAASLFAVLCAWMGIRLVLQRRGKHANQVPEDTARKLADPQH